jgi:hypothetical protein
MDAAVETAVQNKTIDWQQIDLCRFFALVFGPPTH